MVGSQYCYSLVERLSSARDHGLSIRYLCSRNGSTPGHLIGVGAGGLLVVMSNQMAAFFYHYVIIFIEMAVLVQLGNFSCVGA